MAQVNSYFGRARVRRVVACAANSRHLKGENLEEQKQALENYQGHPENWFTCKAIN